MRGNTSGSADAPNDPALNFMKLDPNVKSVLDILPVHEHPPVDAVRAIYKLAKRQMKEIQTEITDSNLKAQLVRSNLTPEQLYIYEWIGYIFTILALPHGTFARQVGVTTQTVKSWLKRKGHLPSGLRFNRLIDIYRMNFLDCLAAELLHGEKIGQWRKAYRPIWEERAEK